MNHEIEAMRTLLAKMGIAKGSRVVIISDNRYEWFVVHMATMQLGGQFVALPTNVTPFEAQVVLKSTLAKVLFVETVASYNAVKSWVGNIGVLEQAICFEDPTGEGSYAVAIAIAADVETKVGVTPNITAEDTAMIMFTAGTTGPPKGVMLSHKNLVANVSSVSAQLGEAITHSDMFMSLCPWTVAGALSTEIYQAMLKGATVCVPPELLEGFHDLETVAPSVIVSVAQPFQRAYANIVDDVQNRGSFHKDMTKFTLGRITENRIMLQKPGKVSSHRVALLAGEVQETVWCRIANCDYYRPSADEGSRRAARRSGCVCGEHVWLSGSGGYHRDGRGRSQ
jgi:long-chain acyl-CoA synthetase